MDYFGETHSRNMPSHFFWGNLSLDHDTAVKANVRKQNFTVCPRHWYLDAVFRCSRCGEKFCFTATEQKYWYEDLGFYVDSCAKDCRDCRRDERRKRDLRQTYDRDVAAVMSSKDVEAKVDLAKVIDELVGMEAELPAKIHEKRRELANQIARLQSGSEE